MKEIYIKAWYGAFKLSTPEQALKFARALFKHMPSGRNGKRTTLINKIHLRGIEFTESELM